MSNEKSSLTKSESHAQQCHNRWLNYVNRDISSPDYRVEWSLQQCGGCRFFIPLEGVLGNDWGGCTNTLSEFDKRIMFEHDGCDAFDPASDGWFAGTYFEDQRLSVDDEGNLINPITREKIDIAFLE